MRRAAVMIVLVVVLVPAAAGAEASYQSRPGGSTVNNVAIAGDGRHMLAGTEGGSVVCLQRTARSPGT